MKISGYIAPWLGFFIFLILAFFKWNLNLWISVLMGFIGFYLVITIDTACKGNC